MAVVATKSRRLRKATHSVQGTKQVRPEQFGMLRVRVLARALERSGRPTHKREEFQRAIDVL